MSIVLYTIGFTQKTAANFFDSLKKEQITTLIDVRLNNVSQLSGFAKKTDLEYFLKEICNIEYIHEPSLAPEKEMLNGYQRGEISWDSYEKRFMELLQKRAIEKYFNADYFNNGCLLCSEKLPHHCHRGLIAKYLQANWDIDIKVNHLF